MSHTIISGPVGHNEITIETGKIAKLADGAVTVRCGDTIVLVTAVSATKLREGQDFFPLTVDYKEKAAAAGQFPGGYFKREGRPTEKEILTARMTDRPLRPLFPKDYFFETQIITIMLSADGENDPDMLSINGASAALTVSDIPFDGPIGAVRIGRVNGEFVINPTHAQREQSDLDLVYVGKENEVIMIEGACDELPEADFKAALDFAQEPVRKLIAMQRELAAKSGKPKRDYPPLAVDNGMLEIAYAVAGDRIEAALYTSGKVARSKAVGALRGEVEAAIKAKFPEATPFAIGQAFDYLQKKPSASASLIARNAATDAVCTTCANSKPKSACCPAPTGPPSSSAVRPRPWPSRPSPRPTRRKTSTPTPAAKRPSASFCTTTSRPSASVKPAASAV